MEPERNGVTWLASYPKSGNTWLRFLLEAYWRNGLIDINDVRISHSDGGAVLMQGLSPMPLSALGFNGQMLLRPAALLNQFCRVSAPTWVKTHFANFQPDGLPHCIPVEFTERAVYVVRDPRSVVLSLAKFYGFHMEQAVEAMAKKDWVIGNNEQFVAMLVSSWSNHVASWAGETRYPVHVVRYEDLQENAEKELAEVVEFLKLEVDEPRIKRAVKATTLDRLKKSEEENGFREQSSRNGQFFGNGGTRWKDELGAKWAAAIEADHGERMQQFGYL